VTTAGLVLAFVSAIAVNWAYSIEHDAAASMPTFSWRRPKEFVTRLLANRRWLLGFGTESAGWLVYLAALALAPISLVQAVAASGIAVLALATARGHLGRLARHEQIAVALALAGLVLLSLSLTGATQTDEHPDGVLITIWLAGSFAAALTLVARRFGLGRGPALGIAAGLLFSAGDVSAKLVVYGGIWLVAIVSLIVCYALGTSILQGAFQYSDALTAAGLATLVTNALPIAAGFLVFGEHLPAGVRGGFQIAAFATLVVSAAFLSRAPKAEARPGDGEPEGSPLPEAASITSHP
jgi:drug/metabolite transporter (DMT)-like permease